MVVDLLSQDLDLVQVSKHSALVVLFSSAGESKDKDPVLHCKFQDKTLEECIQDKQITGKSLESVLFRNYKTKAGKHLLVLGLGKTSDVLPEIFRQISASVVDSAKSLHVKEIFIELNSLPLNLKTSVNMQALVEGLILSSYEFSEFKSKKEKNSDIQVHLLTKDAKQKAWVMAFSEAVTLAQTVNFSRFLGDMPGNKMTPEILAQKTVEASKGTKIKTTIWNKEKIKKERMGGLLGVSLGSTMDPRFIVMEYKGAGAKQKPVVFVGKGLTFDSGGISIKPSANMEEMKYDMCGGANVIGTILAIAKLKLKVNVVGLVPATENMPGPLATKPGDILTARNGKTFEVNNTDAEGRLILSDALVYACEQKPEAIIDAATLTGAMVVALGNTHTGFFTRNQKLKTTIEDAAQRSGEWVWNMPLCDFHVQDMKGTYADLSNISSGKGAGSSTAAAFLEQFVEEGIPWAHFDIAGTAWAVGNRLKYCSKKGASGVMIRTFVEIAKSYIK